MYRPTLKDRVKANLQAGLGMRKITPEEGAAHLNGYADLTDPDGQPWTPGSLAAFMAEHDIHPERVPDLSHFRPVNNDRSWTNPRNILRTIERGFDEEQDELKRRIRDDPEVRRAVIGICAVVNDNPYDPGLYDRWLAHARQYE